MVCVGLSAYRNRICYLLKHSSLEEIVQTSTHIWLPPVRITVHLSTCLFHFLRWKYAVSSQDLDKCGFTPAREVKIIDGQGISSFVLKINDHLVPNADDMTIRQICNLQRDNDGKLELREVIHQRWQRTKLSYIQRLGCVAVETSK